MRFVGIVVLCWLVGCSARPTIEELEAEALRTGDWTAVEKRERIDKKWGVVMTDSECRGVYVRLCQTKSAHEFCECVCPHDRAVNSHWYPRTCLSGQDGLYRLESLITKRHERVPADSPTRGEAG